MIALSSIEMVLREDNSKLRDENKRLREENKHLKEINEVMKKEIQGINEAFKYLQEKYPDKNPMDEYVKRIQHGSFKPRLNKAVDRSAVVRKILELQTTDINMVAKELGVSHSTIRRRLHKHNLYPINLQDIQLEYEILGTE